MKKISIITAAAVLTIFLISCGNSEKGETGAKSNLIEEIQKRGVLRVGMSTFVPWAMQDKTGELIGFEIDVARRLAEDMGVKVEFIPTKWSGIIPALLTGKFDVIIGGMGIRAERNLKVNFSIPYDYTGMSIVASKSIAGGLKTLEDFNRKDFVIAARIGTTAADAVKKMLPLAELKLFDDESQAVQELLNKKAHAVVASTPLPAYQALKNSDSLYMPFEENFTKEPIGFALKKGDVDTLNFFNNWITVVDSEGWLKERKYYWFNTRDWAPNVE
ncbi:MAG: transporter substrate-binding domain-containing protein [Spirochaetia bacterium]|jgi:polar amino acid transport system substrate-binding protein|nr:transporter substrate-binding domain-containing protein [Spirochaetia bacterium]